MKELIKMVAKGVYITPQQITEITGKSSEDSAYGFELMSICKLMEDYDPKVTCKIENGGIAVLDDKHASAYNAGQFARHLFGMERRHKKILTVDNSKLTGGDRKVHNRRVEIMGKILTAAKNALQQEMPELKPTVRAVKNILN